MSFRVKPDSMATPETEQRAYYAGSAWETGALLIVHTDGTWKEAAADPATISGIAMHPVGTGVGSEYPVGYREFPPLYAIATLLKSGRRFLCEYVGAVGTPGVSYGSVRGADGIWRLDFAETTAVQWKFVKSYNVAPLAIPLVEVVVLTSAIVEA